VTQITQHNVILVKGEVVFQGASGTLLSQPDVWNPQLGV
jgi:branched-chain amino acid transport system ATP-binding protein